MNPDEENKNTPMGDIPPDNSSDDGQVPQNEPMQPTTVGGPGKSGRQKWLVWLLVALLILLLAFFGWWWWNEDKKDKTAQNNTNNSQQQEQQPEAEPTCNEGFTPYENAELDVGFCYPTAWGTVTVIDARLQKTATIVDGATIAADTGERWLVSFSEKPAVNLGVVTADWSTEVGRGGSCLDPATQTLPPFSPFSTEWDEQPTIVTRGVEVSSGRYLIEESADEFYNGVCISGYAIINAEDYTHSTATYYKEFGGTITTPEQHAASPNVLAPEADRDEFYVFVKSVHAL